MQTDTQIDIHVATKNNEQIFLHKLSDAELIFDTREAIRSEREATSLVVKYLREINARELYLKHACSSLFQFATEKLGYCAASAQARINAMELVIALPEVEKQIESGELSLTAAAKVQTFFRAEKKAKKTYSSEQKREVVEICLMKSTREVDRELAKRNPEIVRFETLKPVGEVRFELRFTISEELESKIRKLRGLLAHSQPNIRIEELLDVLVELGLEKLDPVRKAQRVQRRITKCAKASVASADEKFLANGGVSDSFRAHETGDARNTRYIAAEVRHQVWSANQEHGCSFVSDGGERCGSQHALQLDHIKGYAREGSNTVDNLRVLCAKHNRFIWRRNFRATRLGERTAGYEAA